MGERFLHFIKYHNAVPITLALVLLSFSGALAASPEVRSDVANAVFTQEQTVKSVDNTYLLSKDLSTFVPIIQITGVTEDADNYYVAYTMQTIDVDNYVWKDVTQTKTLQVPKADLGNGDLGLYVAQKLKDVQTWEKDRLAQTQTIERAQGPSSRVVATVYGGLVGKFLDPKEDVLPGYTPVVASAPESVPSGPASSSGSGGTPSSGTSVVSSNGGLVISIIGYNPSQIPVGSSYRDLGAFVTQNGNVGLRYTTQGVGDVDTTKTGTSTIVYTATDTTGDAVTATREVIVYDPKSGPPIDQSTLTFGGAPVEPVQQDLAPAPTPAPAPTASPDSSASVETTASPTPDTSSSSISTTTSDTSAGTETTASSTSDTSSSTPDMSANAPSSATSTSTDASAATTTSTTDTATSTP